jgi:hypothetical protein
MKRPGYSLLLLALLVPACKTAGPKGPAAAAPALPDLLRSYEGDLRILLHKGDERALTLGLGQSTSGACDLAVRIRSVALEKGAVRFGLETVGLPRVGEHGVTCKRLEPGLQLALTGVPAGAVTSETTALIDKVLLTPDAYLRSKGVTFDYAAGQAPTEVASQQSDANDEERRLARAVVAWPQPLLTVEGTYRDPARRLRYERLVQVEAVVGTDGRLYRVHIKGSPERQHEEALETALRFFRFAPARRTDGPVGARVPLEATFRVY